MRHINFCGALVSLLVAATLSAAHRCDVTKAPCRFAKTPSDKFFLSADMGDCGYSRRNMATPPLPAPSSEGVIVHTSNNRKFCCQLPNPETPGTIPGCFTIEEHEAGGKGRERALSSSGLHRAPTTLKRCYDLMQSADNDKSWQYLMYALTMMYSDKAGFAKELCQMVYNIFQESNEYQTVTGFTAASCERPASMLSAISNVPDVLNLPDCYLARFVLLSMDIQRKNNLDLMKRRNKLIGTFGKAVSAGADSLGPAGLPAAAVGVAFKLLDMAMASGLEKAGNRAAVMSVVSELLQGIMRLDQCNAAAPMRAKHVAAVLKYALSIPAEVVEEIDLCAPSAKIWASQTTVRMEAFLRQFAMFNEVVRGAFEGSGAGAEPRPRSAVVATDADADADE